MPLLVCLPAAGWPAEFDCVIQPRQILEIRSPIEGLIERVMVERGDRVRRGQEIAHVDTSVERVLAESARYRSETEGPIRAARSKVDLATRKYRRAEDLIAQKFVAPQALDEARNELKVADAELQDALDNRRLAEIEYRRQITNIALKTIKSPINGVVMERILNPGELVEAGVGRKPIFKLAETDVLSIEALLPAEVYRQVKAGMVADVLPAIQNEAKYRATVTIIDRVLDPASGTFGVRLEMPNPKGEVLAGVRCRVGFETITAPARAEAAKAPVPAAPRPAPAPATPAPR